uniref:Uncharacterized protein LOC101511498 n=1 Tax=Cicer arietinum TaxID=3827 RepID=A0A1S2XJ36_CICAR|nr:uncharacterized protein LOC101511498 [Cicer arietinum]
MARTKLTAKRKMSDQAPEDTQDDYSSTEYDSHDEDHPEATHQEPLNITPPLQSASIPFPSTTLKSTKPLSSNTSSSPPIRQSSRIMSGVVSSRKTFPKDNTGHVVDSDDSEQTISAEFIPQPSPTKITSKASTPKKAKSPSHKRPSSSSKTSANVQLFDSPILETNYVSKWQKKSVVNGKIIDLADLKQGGFKVEEMFDQLGWTSFFRINEPQYPRLVRAFYAASNGSKGNIGFNIVLKEVHMEINPTTLCQILDIRDEGAYCFSENWYSQCQIIRTSVLQNTLITPPKPQVASNLLHMCCILHNICVHSIVPRAGSFEKVTKLDLLLIHHLMSGTPLHLGNIIFCFMLNAAVLGRSAPYGMILTKIFKFFNLPLDDEQSVHFNNTFSMKKVKHMRLQPHASTPLKSSSTASSASKKKKICHSSSTTQQSEPTTI